MTIAAEHGVPRAHTDHLHCESFGDGEPLLMLAGGPGLSADYLRPVADALADRRRCLLPHPRGTGRSSLPGLGAAPISLAAYVEDLEALRAARGLEAWDAVFGHSFGGMWAMAYAAAFPGRLRRLVLASPGGMDLGFFGYYFDNLLARLTPWERDAFAYWTDTDRVRADPERAGHEQMRAIAPAYFWHRAPVTAFQDGLRDWLVPAVQSRMLQSLQSDGYDVRAAMRAFPAPVRIIQGRQDPLGDGLAWETGAAFPDSGLTFLDRCGHFPWLEQPEAFYAAVRTALEA